MNHSAKGSARTRKGVTVFVILLSCAGAGYAYTVPDSVRTNAATPDNEWRQPAAPSKKLPVISGRPVQPGSIRIESGEHRAALPGDSSQARKEATPNTPRRQSKSLADSDKKKLLVLLALWSIKP